MKYLYWMFLSFAVAVEQAMADFEFGRGALEDTLDMEDALRELIVTYDMSMSMSMSYSYSYDSEDDKVYSGGNVGDSGSNGQGSDGSLPPSSSSSPLPPSSSSSPGVSSPAEPGASTSTPVSSPIDPGAPTSTPGGPGVDLAPTSTSSLADVNLTDAPASSPITAAPVSSPITTGPVEFSSVAPAAPVTPSPTITSCFGMASLEFQSPLFVETADRESISFAVLENVLTEKMRDASLPFCEDLGERRLEDGLGAVDGDYYIGNIDLVAGESGETCSPEQEGNKYCFVAELTLKLFGDATAEDGEYILEVVKGLLHGDIADTMGEALGTEHGLIDDLNTNSTESDADVESNSKASKASQDISAGSKAMISLLTLAVVAFIAVFAYWRINRPPNDNVSDGDDSDGNDDHERQRAAAEREHLYGA